MVVVPEGASVALEAVGVAKEYLDNNQGAKVGVRMVVMVVNILMVLMVMLIVAVGPTVICYVLIVCLEGTAPSALRQGFFSSLKLTKKIPHTGYKASLDRCGS